jgi:DNA-directed RNA polymerase subunit RPC12/RpoP
VSLPDDLDRCPDCGSHDLSVLSHHRVPGVVHRYGYECAACEEEFRAFTGGWALDVAAGLL